MSASVSTNDYLVSTQWLADHLHDADLRVVDATYFLPNVPRNAEAEFAERHIPGAVRFDIDAIKNKADPLPHMLPAAAEFAAAVGALGLGSDTRIVAYDALGLMSAARIWWMFRIFGHDRVSVLDGGLPKWLAEGRPTEAGAAKPKPASFKPKFRPELVRAVAEVKAASESGAQIIDARAAGRFTGAEPEIRPGLRSGHIPGAKNLPYNTLLNPADQTLKSPAEIEALFKQAGIDPDQPLIASCGSGVTACVLAFGLALTGRPDTAVYDGSWTEWGGREDLPLAR